MMRNWWIEWSSLRWKPSLRNLRKSGKGGRRFDDISRGWQHPCAAARDNLWPVSWHRVASWQISPPPDLARHCSSSVSGSCPDLGQGQGTTQGAGTGAGCARVWKVKQSNFTSYHKSVKRINGWHCLVPCCALSLEAEQVIIGKERNIGDGRCPERGAWRGRGRGSSACWWPCSTAPTICNPIRPEPELSPASTGWWSHVEQSEQWPCWRHPWPVPRPRHLALCCSQCPLCQLYSLLSRFWI